MAYFVPLVLLNNPELDFVKILRRKKVIAIFALFSTVRLKIFFLALKAM
jgi:hypothetical protein